MILGPMKAYYIGRQISRIMFQIFLGSQSLRGPWYRPIFPPLHSTPDMCNFCFFPATVWELGTVIWVGPALRYIYVLECMTDF